MGLRALTADDEPNLEQFVLLAAFPPHRQLPDGASDMPHVRRWLDAWGELELGVGWEGEGQVGGAAWARGVVPVIARSAPGEPFPEVLLAVASHLRGRGVGLSLMKALVACAEAAGVPGLCLTVSERNEVAVRLYGRLGFAVTGRRGAGLVIMTRELQRSDRK